MGMGMAETLFAQHLAAVTTDPEAWLALFHPQAVIEFPYAAAIGFPHRLSGHQEIRRYIQSLPPAFKRFEASGIKLYPHVGGESLTAEFTGFIPGDDRAPEYRQRYICLLMTRDGKILHYKEFWDPNAVTQYLSGQGQPR